MFEGMTERRIARAADKVIALKEDIDSLSWGRVFDIGKRLQELNLGEEATDLAHELIGIARSNISLEAKLGIAPSASGTETLASGMPAHPTSVAAGNDDSLEEELALFFENPAEPASISVETEAPCRASAESEAPCFASAESEASHPASTETETETSEPASAEIAVSALGDVAPSEPRATEKGASSERQQAPSKRDEQHLHLMAAEGHDGERKKFATFRSLYSSRDGGLCLYEDESGHLVAIDSSKLA